jgi:hypothetical protein
LGGALAVPLSLLYAVGGFPSFFFGWGGEDDALYDRLSKVVVRIERFAKDPAAFVDLEESPDMGTMKLKKETDRREWQNTSKRDDLARARQKPVEYGSDLVCLARLVRPVESP